MPTKCNSCKGTYSNTQPDGSRYFHACPPIPNPDHQPDASKKNFDPRETIERPNKRDENPKGHDKETLETILISEGDGVTEV